MVERLKSQANRSSDSAKPSGHHAALDVFHPTLARWFDRAFAAPTPAQTKAWPAIDKGQNTLLLAPTGSGKTLAAFLVAINRIMFGERLPKKSVGVLYISPLKALGVDVERNLRAPLAGVRVVAAAESVEHHHPTVAVRSGDTPSADRYRINRDPPDILITTPESLYLMLTSRAREVLQSVHTVIIDEIHSVVGNKRGAHLFLSLERLEWLRHQNSPTKPLQRIGLSATQRPLAEIARLLGGAQATSNPEESPGLRHVEIVEAGRSKQLDLRIEVPVEDMSRLGALPSHQGPAAGPDHAGENAFRPSETGPSIPSIWPSIHPRLVELIKQHRSTMIFVNSRRLAERLASAINEVADKEIALAHHGSIAKDTRLQIEDRLKRGQIPAIVATSSLELGIDMGAVDLVIQIEAPPTIASGIQRIGRAGHQVGANSSGIIFPKFRGDLLACSAAAERMQKGEVEETYYPRNPLDVLAQQIVAMVSLEPMSTDEIYSIVRGAAPFHELPKSSFDGVLDLLSGRYPSHEFSELRPRINWDRLKGEVSPRKGTQRLAILNAGTIPDRGLYGVFLANDDGRSSRVGELDEEMVFETRPGDVFLLGASSWRVLDITSDRVLVAPAPGEPGRMPFWRGDGPGRPMEFGIAIGKLTQQLVKSPKREAKNRLTKQHALDPGAADNLLNYLHDQVAATDEVPSDKMILVECFLDEVGDWRVCILSPFGSRVHAPWATAVAARLASENNGEVDMMWTDDGIIFRMPETDEPPPIELFFPRSDEVEDEVVSQLGSTALFAARFRENAARALLLPRRTPGKRTPLWLQRRRSADLLAVASRYASFPIMLETYRECLRDVFDIRGLKGILKQIENRTIHLKMVRTGTASPFASALMFNYTGNYIYDGDAPLAERRAATLALDQAQLRELLGSDGLRELLDGSVIEDLGIELQLLEAKYPVRDADGLHDLLLKLGDLSASEIVARFAKSISSESDVRELLTELNNDRRVIEVRLANELRYIAVEDASRYRDTVGIVPPAGLADAFLESVESPIDDLVSRYARTHAPFAADAIAQRLAIGITVVNDSLKRLAARDRVLEGEFTPGGRGREWCDTDVLRKLKRRSLAKLREQIEPVEPQSLARFLPQWHNLDRPRRGLDGLLDAIEQIQGFPIPALDLENHVLPSRVLDFKPADLDELCSAGEIVWRGVGGLTSGDGRVTLFLTDNVKNLVVPSEPLIGETYDAIRKILAERGAVFFEELSRALGGFKNDLLDALWDLVWAGEATNDTLVPLRSVRRSGETQKKGRRANNRFRSRRLNKTPGSEGRWSLLFSPATELPTPTERQTALAVQLIERHGVITRESITGENLTGGFSGIYPILKAMEESGRVRRGYFVEGLGAAQFAAPGADDRLREENADKKTYTLAATDPASAYGLGLKWPAPENQATLKPGRIAGARVIISDGRLIGFLSRTNQHLITFVDDDSSRRVKSNQTLVDALVQMANDKTAVLLEKINGDAAVKSPLAETFQAAGFVISRNALMLRRTLANEKSLREK